MSIDKNKEDYLNSYSKTYNIDTEEASQHALVKEVFNYYDSLSQNSLEDSTDSRN